MTRNNQWNRYQHHGSGSGSGSGYWKGKNSDDKWHRADDQIAPTGVSASTDHLQRWALMTAGMQQQRPLRLKTQTTEDEMRERIHRRYQVPRDIYELNASAQSRFTRAPDSSRSTIDLTGDKSPLQTRDNTSKRRLSTSPSPARAMSRTGLSAVSYVRSTKRRRSRSPSTLRASYATTARSRDMEKMETHDDGEEIDYAQSSDWSFPSSQGGEGEVK